MKVYLVQHGSHDNRGVLGIYASLEAAQAAYPAPPDGTDDWVQSDDVDWRGRQWARGWNVKDPHAGFTSDGYDIEEYEVQGS